MSLKSRLEKIERKQAAAHEPDPWAGFCVCMPSGGTATVPAGHTGRGLCDVCGYPRRVVLEMPAGFENDEAQEYADRKR